MKKLMIAAALAAMVGGAFADTAYTFSASVKTTVGKAGKTTTTYNLGVDAAGTEFWYQNAAVQALITADSAITNPKDRYFTTKRVGGTTVPALSSKAKKDNAWLIANIVPLAATYTEKSANKWCDSFKVTAEGCYRVAGTRKVSDVVVGDICCAGLTGADYTIDETEVLASVQRFGGLTYAAAKKAEIFAKVTGTGISAAYLAGQGSVGKVIDNDLAGTLTTVDGITSLSGNIVGVIVAPECEYCCTANQPAGAFACGTTTIDTTLETAAYGTFSIKYNAKETKAL